jgi:hypothetical protein
MTEPLKLGIGIPAYGFHLDVGHAAMWLGLGAALTEAREKVALHWFAEYHINGIDLCRNTIVYDAMKAGCDWVFMVDADTFHRSTGAGGIADAIGDAGVDIVQMIRDADRGQYPVEVTPDPPRSDGGIVLRPIPMPKRTNGVGLIGAPVRGRGGNAGVCVQELIEYTGDPDDDGRPFRVGSMFPLESLVGRITAVSRIGGACIAVNCGWLRRFWPQGPWFEMQHDYSERPRNARGEDYSICDGIYERGGVVLCDGRFVPSHVDRRRLVGENP